MATTKKSNQKTAQLRKSKPTRRVILLTALGVAAAILLLVGVINNQRNASKTSTITPKTLGTTPQSTPTGKVYAQTGGAASPSPTPNAGSSSASQLPAPSGQLLNVQTVSLTSGPGLESVCQTIANASCNIRLTNGSTIKYVGAQSTGSNGDVIFNWTAKAVGLMPGYWTVQAVVTQNGGIGVSHSEYLTVNP